MRAQLLRSAPAEFFQISASGDECCSAISIGGVSRGDRIDTFESRPFESAAMNISMSRPADSRAAESWSASDWCCPGADLSCCSNEVQGVSNLNLQNLTPMQNDSPNGINDCNSISAELKLRSHEEEIAQYADSERQDKNQKSGTSAFESDSVVAHEEGPSDTNRCKNEGVLWSENNSLHHMILSQQQLLQDGFAS